MKPSEWPPDVYTGEQGYARTFTRQTENSFTSSIPTDDQENHLEQVASWCERHGKVFHNTPALPNRQTTDDPTDTAAAPRSAARGAACRRPPIVIRGANGQTEPDEANGATVSLDWLTMSGPRAARQRAISLVESFFGDLTPGNGLHFLNSGMRLGPNSGVFFDEGCDKPKEHCVVNIAGAYLTELGSLSMCVQLIDELMRLGFKGTRVDVALDFYDKPDLIKLAHRSCQEKHLTGAKTYALQEQHSSGSTTGRTLYIGKRGKNGSGRFLRVYDKGLETQTKEEGEWIRWEVVYSSDCAEQVLHDLANADDAVQPAVQHALGVVDFRLSPGQKLARRARCKWFEQLLGAVRTIRATQSRVASTIHTKVRWFKSCVAPFLRTAQRITGNTVDRVMQEITGDVNPNPRYLDDPLMRCVCDSLGVTPYQLKPAYQAAIAGGA